MQFDLMPGNKYNGISSVPTSRVERLLRDRELRKSSRASHPNEANDTNRGTEVLEHEGDNLGSSHVEQHSETAAIRGVLSEECEKQETRPARQRLLVVANRLPVSAIRRGEESWSLEISAGGLVSALLGKLLF